MLHPDRRKMTREEYLAESESWDEKYEWINGEIWLMSGGRPVHAAVAVNVIVALSALLAGRPCRATSSDQRVHVLETDALLYPDVTVVCGRFEFSGSDRYSVTNPVLVVEVLSPPTVSYDRGAKFEHYIRVPSLVDVLFVDPDRRMVSLHTRQGKSWLRTDIHEGAVHLPSIDVDLSVAAMFADLENVEPPAGP